MTLDQLRYFQAVCKYDSVSRAAEALNISQPSVSNAVANLEREFGIDLFTRQHKRLQLTKEGLYLLEWTEKLLAETDEMSRNLRDLGSRDKVLRLGVPPMIGSLVLPTLYDKHFKRFPKLQVHIVEDDGSGLRRQLAENQIDMAFLPHTRPFDSTFGSVLLTELQNVCCVSRSHRFADRKSIRLEELKDEPLVLFKDSFFQTERILEAFDRLTCTPNVLLYTAQLSTLQNMVAGNTAVGFLFESLPESSPSLVGIPLDPPMTTRLSLVWRKDSHLSTDMKNLIEFIANN